MVDLAIAVIASDDGFIGGFWIDHLINLPPILLRWGSGSAFSLRPLQLCGKQALFFPQSRKERKGSKKVGQHRGSQKPPENSLRSPFILPAYCAEYEPARHISVFRPKDRGFRDRILRHHVRLAAGIAIRLAECRIFRLSILLADKCFQSPCA